MINKVLKFLPISIFFLIVLIFFYLLISKNDPSKLPSVLLNKEAPKFEAYSLVNKKKFLFDKEFSEELIIVNFFSSWCIPCKTEHNFIKKLSNKKNLSNIFLQIKDNENNEIINLDTGLIEKNNINKKSNLIIKMTLETFNSIKNNKKNPEDLLFEEKIKISGDINLLQ